LTTVCSRDRISDEDFVKIVTPLYAHDSVESLRSVYHWAAVNAQDIDDAKYTILKKLSKLLSRLGGWVEKRPNLLPEGSDLQGFFGLLFEVAKNISLSVSEPVLRIWSHLLRSRVLKDSEIIQQSIGPLMEMCSQRLVRYESLPDDSSDETFLFLAEDFDTLPEKHQFLGNYRRYCVEVVEAVVRKFPADAVNHILGQAQTLYQEIQQTLVNFQPREFSKRSTAFLRLDAQVMIVDAAVKGYTKWLDGQEDLDPQQNEQARNAVLSSFTSYYENVLPMEFKDPAIQRRVLSSLVALAVRIYRKTRPDLALGLLDRLLKLNVEDIPSLHEYSEAAKSLMFMSVTESQKIAGYFADNLLPMYDELETRIQEKLTTQNLDEAHRLGYSAFLFTIIHRAKTLDNATKVSKLKDMMSASTQAWTDPAFTVAVSEFNTFYEVLGFGHLPDYLYSHNFHKIQDWQSQPLDLEGQAMQSDVTYRIDHIPHRATRNLLMACFDKLPDDDPAYDPACTLWADTIPAILPNLLQTLRHAHAFGDRTSWPQLPAEMQQVLNRILIDRFWQAGISTESMDDFYARVSSSRHTYEGFASTIRGSLRQVREKSYSILCYLTRLKEKFYGLPDLPEVLATAVYGTAHCLSAHQTSILLTMSQQLIGHCPIELRQHFLPSIITALFTQLNQKLNSEWAAVNHRTSQASEDDNLNDEMKSESILRLLTYNAVTVANSLLDTGEAPCSNFAITC
jgi:exportin-5